MAAEGASRKRAAAADGGDRLSALPDELLHSILSFLPARQVVQTSVLSHRWSGLWRSTPCLNIDQREFAKSSAAAGYNHTDEQEAWDKLLRFASNLLENHRAPALETFRVHIGALLSPFAVDSWIRHAIATYRAAALEISMAPSGSYWFTPTLLVPDDAAAGRRLTRIRLCRVRLTGAFADQLRSGSSFPALEDLALARCDFAFQAAELSSPTLRSLAIDCCERSSSPIMSRSVTAPKLASFQLIFPKHARQDAFAVNGGSRLRASVAPSCDGAYLCFGHKDMSALLGSLCNVTTLELWRFSYQIVRIHSSNSTLSAWTSILLIIKRSVTCYYCSVLVSVCFQYI
ncbi:unnamed protein product [Urochloa humidicola]